MNPIDRLQFLVGDKALQEAKTQNMEVPKGRHSGWVDVLEELEGSSDEAMAMPTRAGKGQEISTKGELQPPFGRPSAVNTAFVPIAAASHLYEFFKSEVSESFEQVRRLFFANNRFWQTAWSL